MRLTFALRLRHSSLRLYSSLICLEECFWFDLDLPKCRNLYLSKIEGVLVIKLNRPQALNALNTDLMTELSQTLDFVNRDDNCKAVVLTGDEKSFAGIPSLIWMHIWYSFSWCWYSRNGFKRIYRELQVKFFVELGSHVSWFQKAYYSCSEWLRCYIFMI